MSVEEIVRSATSRAGLVRVQNALNPLLWTVACGTPVSFVAAYVLRDDALLRYGLVTLGALPVLSSLIAYFILLVRDPDRLQSEEYRIKQQAIQVLHSKGRGSDIVDVASEAPRIERTRPRSGDGEKP